MSIDCIAVIGILCFFQILDIIQIRAIKAILKEKKDV